MTTPREDRKGLLREALLRIEELEQQLARSEHRGGTPIAIIGLACRLPGGADDPEAYWRVLKDGVDAIGEVPADRWDVSSFYDPDPEAPGKMSSRFGGFLPDVSRFDADFFGVAPREALKMDPQHRLVLEVAWEALENAAVSPHRLEGSRTGVFVGITGNDYLPRLNDAHERIDAYHLTGSFLNFAAGRISYLLGLQGPALAVDTACSSSLVGVHLACQSLRSAECRMALAAGVNLILSPEITIAASKSRMLAPDGRCKTFDARADGFVRSEGCGVVVLKRLADALGDGDRVLAVIRGSAVNQDGKSSGLTVPNKLAQEAVIREALAAAGVAPAEVGYVEAHGTGTPLGDPIEVRALGAALGSGRQKERPFLLGSVKTNVGHLESAAGVAGLIKVVLALQHEAIPPHLHLRQPSPLIAWDEIPVRIPTALTPWTRGGERRIGGVSSFGASGTNAHVVVEEAPALPLPSPGRERPIHLLPLSARSESALQAVAARLERRLAGADATPLADVGFTLGTGRGHFSERAALVVRTTTEARDALRAIAESTPVAGIAARGRWPGRVRPDVAFLFTGQGCQYAGMGRELYETQPTFRSELERCAELLLPYLDEPLLEVMFGERGSLLDETAYTQPALFALEWSLSQLWRSWGVAPAVVMGHSAGEYAAACVAGVMELSDGVRLIAQRGRLMQSLPREGAMVSLLASEERVRAAIAAHGGEVSIGAVNGPESVVISGRREAVEAVSRELEGLGIKTKALSVSHASHSALMEPVLDEFERVAAGIAYGSPRVGLVSNVTGRLVKAGEIDASYWRRHLRQGVEFHAGMQTLREQGCEVFVEVGPSPVLLGMGQLCVAEGQGAWLPTLRRERGAWEQALTSLGELWVRGVDVDWSGFDRDYPRRKLDLPTYPFERQRYWVDPGWRAGRHSPRVAPAAGAHPLLGSRVSTPLKTTVFECSFATETLPFLCDHRVRGKAVVPAAAYLEMALAAGASALGEPFPRLSDVLISEPMRLEDGEARIVQVLLAPDDEGGGSVQIHSQRAGDDGWRLHAEGRLRRGCSCGPPEDLASIRSRCAQAVPAASLYEGLRQRGLEFGPAFRGVESLSRGEGEALAHVRLPEGVRGAGYRFFHPALLDACLQAVAAALPATADGSEAYLPLAVSDVCVFAAASGRLWSHARVRSADAPEAVLADIAILDEAGTRVAEVTGLRLLQLPAEGSVSDRDDEDLGYEIVFRPAPLPSTRATVSPSEGLAALATQLEPLQRSLAERSGLASYSRILPDIEELSAEYVQHALVQLGWTPQTGERVSSEGLATRLGVSADRRRLFGRLLEILGEAGVLSGAGSEWRVARPLASSPTEERERHLSALLADNTDCRSQLSLLGRCGEHLASVLRGESDPLELLFPGGSLELAEGLNKDTPFARFHNGLVEAAVDRLVRDLPPGGRVRVLEVGAGTGSATSYVLPRLPRDRTEYVFTDLSTLFTARAQEKFEAYPFVRYGILDIEMDPVAQGFEPHAFDLVLAANVLHATRDLAQTLGNVRRLLSPGGTLVLLEATERQRWVDLTFGLTEGWWRFADAARRPSYPLLSAVDWSVLLAEIGLTETALVPQPGSDAARECQQTVILGRAPQVRESSSTGRWLVFADTGGFGRGLADQLAGAGADVTMVFAGSTTARSAGGSWTLDGSAPADFVKVVRDAAEGRSWTGVVHLWGLDATTAPASVAQLERDVAAACGSVLHLVQALAVIAEAKDVHGVWLLSRGAQATSAADAVAVTQAPLTGLAKVIGLEHPELNAVHVDLDPAARLAPADEVAALLRELVAGDGESQVVLRGTERLVPRVVRWRPKADARSRQASPASVRVEIARRGVLENLELRPAARRSPGPGEVEIRVRASGLNFRDVLSALDMYPGEPGPLGVECAGEIVSLGEGVEGLRPGDEVVGLATGSLASFVTTDARLVVLRPTGMSAVDAATIPSTFVTAWYALHRLARLRPGERVLIHAAAGGVGLSALQVARRAGAQVLATAGSPEKREYLRSLGIEHVMDSRSLEFAPAVLTATGGRGVDVVLNSLTGPFIPASLSLLADGGRFIELGQREVWDAARVAAVRPGASYAAFNLLEICKREPELAASMLRELFEAFADGSLTPLPRREFPLADAVSAFRYMAQARHIGKIVLTHDAGETEATRASSFRHDGTYLVTGGLSGLGLLVAEWLAERGAGQLLLLGRRAPDATARQVIARLERAGTQVRVAQADVAREDQVEAVLADARRQLPPLRGVIHAAGTLDDGVLLQQDWSRFAKVMAAKVSGSWILDALTRDAKLDVFVLFSSAVSFLGRPGQGNHAAANAFEDALAHARRRDGLSGTSINWGAWGEVGSVIRADVAGRIAARGFATLAPEQGLRSLGRVLEAGPTQVAMMVVDWPRFFEGVPEGREPRLLAEVAREARARRAGRAAPLTRAEPSLLERLAEAAPAMRSNLLVGFVHGHALRVLGLDPARSIDPQQPLRELGLDSLMAVELRNALGVALGRSLPATLLFDYPTLGALAGHLGRLLVPESAPESAPPASPRDEVIAQLGRLSEDEAEALLLEELREPKGQRSGR